MLEQLLKVQSHLGTDMQEAILDLLAGGTGSSATSLIGTLLVGSRMLSEQTDPPTEPTRVALQPQGDVRMGRRGRLEEAARGRDQQSERWRCSEASVDANWPTVASPWTCRCGAVWTLEEPEGSRSPGDSDADSPSPRGTASSTDSRSPDGIASNADSRSSMEPPTPPPATDDLSRFVMA